jgi:hypothetical protein
MMVTGSKEGSASKGGHITQLLIDWKAGAERELFSKVRKQRADTHHVR